MTNPASTGREGRIVLPDGRTLSYMEFGSTSGLPVFGFHGTPGSRTMFQIGSDAASSLDIRLVAPDRPGCGQSTPQSNRRLIDYPPDIVALANALGIAKFAVAGVSGGAPYAAACAAVLPDRVSAMALVSPMGPVISPEGAPTIGTRHHMLFRMASGFTPMLKGGAFLGQTIFTNAPDTAYGLLLKRLAPVDRAILMRPTVKQSILDGFREGFSMGGIGAIQDLEIFGKLWNIPFDAIRAPTVVWHGSEDFTVPDAAARRLADIIDGAQFVKLSDAGHYWIFDNISDVLETLRRMAGDARLAPS